jgi:hypothetical protein
MILASRNRQNDVKKIIKIGKQTYFLYFSSGKVEVSIARAFIYSNAFFFRRIFLKKNNTNQVFDELIACSNDYQVKKGKGIAKQLKASGLRPIVISPETIFQNITQNHFIFFMELYFFWIVFFIRILRSYKRRKSPMKVMLIQNSMRYMYNLFCAEDILSKTTKVISIDPSDPFSRSFMYARGCEYNKTIVIPFGFPSEDAKNTPIDSKIYYGVSGLYSAKKIERRSKSKKVQIIGDVFGLGNLFDTEYNPKSVLFISAPHINKQIGGVNGQVSEEMYKKILSKLITANLANLELRVRPHPVDNNLDHLSYLESRGEIKIDHSENIGSGLLIGFSSTMIFDALVKKVPFICLVDGMENDHLELKKNGYPYVFDFNSNLRNIFHVNKDNDFRDTLKMYVEYSGDNATKQLIHFLKKI